MRSQFTSGPTCAQTLAANPCTRSCTDLTVNILGLPECLETVFFRTSWRWRCETDRCSSQCQEGPVGCIQVKNLVCLGRSSIESKFSFSNFRVGAPEGEFQISMDCTYRPNDVVPIIGKKLLTVSKKCVLLCCWT